MNKETREQIEKEAESWLQKLPWVESYKFPLIKESFTAGATAQHPKAWNAAIEACAAHIRSYADIHNCVAKELESLKLDPNQA